MATDALTLAVCDCEKSSEVVRDRDSAPVGVSERVPVGIDVGDDGPVCEKVTMVKDDAVRALLLVVVTEIELDLVRAMLAVIDLHALTETEAVAARVPAANADSSAVAETEASRVTSAVPLVLSDGLADTDADADADELLLADALGEVDKDGAGVDENAEDEDDDGDELADAEAEATMALNVVLGDFREVFVELGLFLVVAVLRKEGTAVAVVEGGVGVIVGVSEPLAVAFTDGAAVSVAIASGPWASTEGELDGAMMSKTPITEGPAKVAPTTMVLASAATAAIVNVNALCGAPAMRILVFVATASSTGTEKFADEIVWTMPLSARSRRTPALVATLRASLGATTTKRSSSIVHDSSKTVAAGTRAIVARSKRRAAPRATVIDVTFAKRSLTPSCASGAAYAYDGATDFGRRKIIAIVTQAMTSTATDARYLHGPCGRFARDAVDRSVTPSSRARAGTTKPPSAASSSRARDSVQCAHVASPHSSCLEKRSEGMPAKSRDASSLETVASNALPFREYGPSIVSTGGGGEHKRRNNTGGGREVELNETRG